MTLRDFSLRIAFTIGALIVSLLFTSWLITLIGEEPLKVFEYTWDGAFKNTNNTAKVFNFFIPLALASVGLVVTFTAGLWNIGVEGQMVMGAIFASWGALFLDFLPQLLLIPACIILSAIGGMLWALLAGVLKTRFGVHEIFGGVALNALAASITVHMISGPWQPAEGGSMHSSEEFLPVAHLPTISADFQVSALMLVIVLVSFLTLGFSLRSTRWGLALKATGKNARSALLMGVHTERISLSAFATCGALAGIGGSYRVLHTYHSLRPMIGGGIGFLGLLVVLLVAFNVILVPLIAFALSAMYAGSDRVHMLLHIDQSLVGVFQGVIVLTILLSNGIQERFRFRKRTNATNGEEQTS
jgi:general nucleoside transport system permease protein